MNSWGSDWWEVEIGSVRWNPCKYFLLSKMLLMSYELVWTNLIITIWPGDVYMLQPDIISGPSNSLLSVQHQAVFFFFFFFNQSVQSHSTKFSFGKMYWKWFLPNVGHAHWCCPAVKPLCPSSTSCWVGWWCPEWSLTSVTSEKI